MKNLSSVKLSEETVNRINRGLQFIHPLEINVPKLLLTLWSNLRPHVLPPKHRDDLETDIRRISTCFLKQTKLRQRHQNNSISRLKQQLTIMKTELQEADMIATHADKSHCAVIIDRSIYSQKCKDYIDSADNTRVEIDQGVLLRRLQRQLKELLKEHRLFFAEDLRNATLINPNPQIARLNGLPKIHKTNCPICPIISGMKTTTYKLAKCINGILTSLVRPNLYSINSTRYTFFEGF